MIHKSFDIPQERIDEMVGTTNKTMVYSNKKEKWHQQTDKLIDKKLQIQSIKLLS